MTATERRRLTPLEEKTIAPFVRAQQIEDISLYWLPVSTFPMRPDQREWLMDFHRRIAEHMAKESQCREELFLRFKSIYPDLNDQFSRTSMEFAPIMGGGIAPGSSLPEKITMDALKEQVDEATKKGTLVDVQRWMPDMTYWFAKKLPEKQRECFLGFGGLVTLFLQPDPFTKPPEIKLPRIVTSMPSFQQMGGEARFASEAQFAYSLRDPFLAKSKEVFGGAYREDPSYGGLLFVIPLFTAGVLLAASAQQKEEWFTLFDGYIAESLADKGVLLALKSPDFDESLAEILEVMREEGRVYRD